MSSMIARDEVLRVLDCPKCRSLVERETSGDAEDLGDTLSLSGATEAGLARQMGETFEGATHRNCQACGRAVALRGAALQIDLLRPVMPRLDCPRCAAFIDACGGPLLPPQRGLVRVRAPPEEPARGYGHGRLVLDVFRCDVCARVVRTNEVRGAREVTIEILTFDGPLGGPAPGPRMLLAEADASIECPRCSGFVREVAPAGLFLADDGRTLAFSGGSHALLVAHLGGESPDHDRTCPDCSRQTCLETDLSGRRARNGPGRLEIQPGGLGPLVDGCQTCAPLVAQALTSPRHLIRSPDTERSFQRQEATAWLPLALWGSVQERYHVSRKGDVARCDECGRGARLVRHWTWPVELGLRAIPGAARSRRAALDCARCEAFVASEEFPVVVGRFLEIHADPEPTYGAPAYRAPGRFTVSGWKCGDCAREILCEEDGHGWVVKVALSRP